MDRKTAKRLVGVSNHGGDPRACAARLGLRRPGRNVGQLAGGAEGLVRALPLTDTQLALFRQCTGRATAPTAPFSTVYAVCGRGAGKSFVLCLIAVYLSCFRDWMSKLAPGQRPTTLILAPTKEQAKIDLSYCRGILESSPILSKLIVRMTAGAMLDDQTIEKIAKAQIDGEDLSTTKADWMTAIEARAETIYANLPLSPQQKFSKAIGGSAELNRGTVVNGGDRLAKLYYEALKHAPPAPPEKPEPPVNIRKADAKARGPAHEQMLELARRLKAVMPDLTDAQVM